jgi:hypothetical protein
MNQKIFIILIVFFVLLSGCVSEPQPGKGTIQFSSSPSGAQVYLDNQFSGSTPSSLTGITPGNHTLEFRYPGYESWSTVMIVSAGSNNVFAALRQQPGTTTPADVVAPVTTTVSPVLVTIQSNRDRMVIGDSISFTGRAEGCNQVLLTIYGPGSYADGMSLVQQNVNSLGTWDYTWNPGTKIKAGTYTMVVNDPYKTVTARKEFTVTGGGTVSITASSFSVPKATTIQFSGRCTTGSSNVNLVLYGPDQLARGVDLGIVSVDANKNWNFPYTFDLTSPTGIYTMTASDIPKTTSDSVQFTVGFA